MSETDEISLDALATVITHLSPVKSIQLKRKSAASILFPYKFK